MCALSLLQVHLSIRRLRLQDHQKLRFTLHVEEGEEMNMVQVV